MAKESGRGETHPLGSPVSRSPNGWEGYRPETDAARERRLAKEAETATRRKERRIAETEEAITAAETKIAKLGAALTDHENATKHEILAGLHDEITETEAQLERLLAVWEDLQVLED
jgi:flagellar motility protein MotE (MotC chaperone)